MPIKNKTVNVEYTGVPCGEDNKKIKWVSAKVPYIARPCDGPETCSTQSACPHQSNCPKHNNCVTIDGNNQCVCVNDLLPVKILFHLLKPAGGVSYLYKIIYF